MSKSTNPIDNTFILSLQKQKTKTDTKRNILAQMIKFFNGNQRFLKLKFKNDNLNRVYQIKNTKKYDSKENMLAGDWSNVEQAINIYHLLTQTVLLKIPGDIVELGSYDGTTSILIQKTLDQLGSKKTIHAYDSFEGLPEKSTKDGVTAFYAGSCKTQKEALIHNFKQHKTKLPKIHEGWFADTLPKGLPKQISFAHLDGDFYSSIFESLINVYPKLSKGAIVVIDDYSDPKVHDVNNILPGVKKACDEFFKDKKEQVGVLIAGGETHGYFRKL
ncbi:MAG: TylF/MycF/NovP-related O-methyltransferase [Patescibacteria group bacterium]